MKRCVRVMLVTAMWVAFGCGPSGAAPCTWGSEGCRCLSDSTCSAKLSCDANRCVKAHGNATSSTSGASDAGTRAPNTPSVGMPAGAGRDAAGRAAAPPGGTGGNAAGRAGAPAVAAGAPATPATAGASGAPNAGGGGSFNVVDAGLDATASCVRPGGNCASTTCCDAALCVQDVCAADCSRNDECITACCFKLSSGNSVCAPTNVCGFPPVPTAGVGGTPVPTGTVIESRIDGEFTGWTGQTVFKLQNGQYWQQVSYAYTYHYAYSPHVIIAKEGSSYQLHVDGVDSSIAVELLDVVIESQITGDFNGWDGDTTFKLANGQIWQQSAPAVVVDVAVLPTAVIYQKAGYFEMSVQGVDGVVQVKQLQ